MKNLKNTKEIKVEEKEYFYVIKNEEILLEK